MEYKILKKWSFFALLARPFFSFFISLSSLLAILLFFFGLYLIIMARSSKTPPTRLKRKIWEVVVSRFRAGGGIKEGVLILSHLHILTHLSSARC